MRPLELGVDRLPRTAFGAQLHLAARHAGRGVRHGDCNALGVLGVRRLEHDALGRVGVEAQVDRLRGMARVDVPRRVLEVDAKQPVTRGGRLELGERARVRSPSAHRPARSCRPACRACSAPCTSGACCPPGFVQPTPKPLCWRQPSPAATVRFVGAVGAWLSTSTVCCAPQAPCPAASSVSTLTGCAPSASADVSSPIEPLAESGHGTRRV